MFYSTCVPGSGGRVNSCRPAAFKTLLKLVSYSEKRRWLAAADLRQAVQRFRQAAMVEATEVSLQDRVVARQSRLSLEPVGLDKNDGDSNLNRRCVLVFVLGYLTIQILTPLIGLTVRGQSRFSWKMFLPEHYASAQFSVVFIDGSIHDLEKINETNRFALVLRPEVDKLRFVPRHICKNMPSAAAVLVKIGDREELDVCQ